MKVIGISGAQGQGKSTLINEVIKLDPTIQNVGAQTSRELLADWGFTLDEVNSYMPLKIKFQEELIVMHYQKLSEILNDIDNIAYDTFIIERTFADIFAYALLSVGPFNKYSTWLNEYEGRCIEKQKSLFNHVVYLSGREYTPEDDGVRSTNPHFSSLADTTIRKYSLDFSDNVTEITEPDLQKRTVELLTLINNL